MRAHLLALDPPVRCLTVNAAVHARPIYAWLGFEAAGDETASEDGIIASPMRLHLDNGPVADEVVEAD